MSGVPMTEAGYRKLKGQLEHLTGVERPRLQKVMEAARAHGDLSENAEFETAREDLWQLDRRIKDLHHILARTKIMDPAAADDGQVCIESLVTVEDLDTGRKKEYRVASASDPDMGAGSVSAASPLGRALMDKQEGDEVEVKTPGGVRRLKITTVNNNGGPPDA